MTAPKAQYKWVAKYPDRLPENSGWMDQKKEVIRDFAQFIETEQLLRHPFPGTTIDPIKPDPNSRQDHVYYLDKRFFMDNDINNPDSFFIYTMNKKEYRQFRWKVKCQWNVFSLANDPAWTLHKGPWMGDFYECIQEYSELFPGNCAEIMDRCFTQGYIYLRSLMPALPFQLEWKKTLMNCVKKHSIVVTCFQIDMILLIFYLNKIMIKKYCYLFGVTWLTKRGL